jgi:hypothetical protein
MQAFKKFVFRELLFAIAIAIIAFVLFQSVLEEYYLPVFWFLYGLITVFTAVFHFSILQVSDKNASKFSSKFMMVSGIKMIAYLILIVFYVFSYPEKARFFLISFFILYMLYTFFEVILIVNYFKKKK